MRPLSPVEIKEIQGDRKDGEMAELLDVCTRTYTNFKCGHRVPNKRMSDSIRNLINDETIVYRLEEQEVYQLWRTLLTMEKIIMEYGVPGGKEVQESKRIVKDLIQ